MTVVEPSVSTDSSRRTSAPRSAIRVALIASESESVGSSPSGTSATITPTENRKPSRGGVPSATAIPKKTTPAATAKAAITRTAPFICTRSGVGRRTTSPVSVEIAPEPRLRSGRDDHRDSRARGDVRPREDDVAGVREVGRLLVEWIGVAFDRLGLTGEERVVDASPAARITRASAEIESPSASTTTSPGTSSPAGILRLPPVAPHHRRLGQEAARAPGSTARPGTPARS